MQDFAETLELVKDYKFASLFINQFYPRPGTPAARMRRVPTHEVKARSRVLSQLFQSYQPYGHKRGQRQTVLVTELSHDQQHYVGHNKFYEQVRPVMLLGHCVVNQCGANRAVIVDGYGTLGTPQLDILGTPQWGPFNVDIVNVDILNVDTLGSRDSTI